MLLQRQFLQYDPISPHEKNRFSFKTKLQNKLELEVHSERTLIKRNTLFSSFQVITTILESDTTYARCIGKFIYLYTESSFNINYIHFSIPLLQTIL